MESYNVNEGPGAPFESTTTTIISLSNHDKYEYKLDQSQSRIYSQFMDANRDDTIIPAMCLTILFPISLCIWGIAWFLFPMYSTFFHILFACIVVYLFFVSFSIHRKFIKAKDLFDQYVPKPIITENRK